MEGQSTSTEFQKLNSDFPPPPPPPVEIKQVKKAKDETNINSRIWNLESLSATTFDVTNMHIYET